jgi:hypothetical protein
LSSVDLDIADFLELVRPDRRTVSLDGIFSKIWRRS